MNAPAATQRPAGRIDWRQVSLLYGRELRAALRERNIVINSVLLPIFLYPVILWAMFSGIMFVQGQTAGFESRVQVADVPAAHRDLRDNLAQAEHIRLVEPGSDRADVDARIADGRLDALVEFTRAGEALPHNFRIRVTYDKSKERSVNARQRIDDIVRDYRSDWLARAAAAHGLSPATWQVLSVTRRDVASPRQTGRYVLGLMLPIFFVIMVAMGSFYPAVDATAGERERNTWETLMTTAASRASIVTAKYLYVASLGGLAGILNLAAMTATLGPIFKSAFGGGGHLQFSIPWTALPLLAVAAVLLAGFVAAGMMILASFARTFREGQTMITPFYLLILLPVMFLQTPGLKFSVALASVPVVNVFMLIRSAVSGQFPAVPVAITLIVSVLLIYVSLRIATFILRFEDVMLGAYRGNFKRFVQERVFSRSVSSRRSTTITHE